PDSGASWRTVSVHPRTGQGACDEMPQRGTGCITRQPAGKTLAAARGSARSPSAHRSHAAPSGSALTLDSQRNHNATVFFSPVTPSGELKMRALPVVDRKTYRIGLPLVAAAVVALYGCGK